MKNQHHINWHTLHSIACGCGLAPSDFWQLSISEYNALIAGYRWQHGLLGQEQSFTRDMYQQLKETLHG